MYTRKLEYTEADDNGNKGLIIEKYRLYNYTETENSNYNTRWFVADVLWKKPVEVDWFSLQIRRCFIRFDKSKLQR